MIEISAWLLFWLTVIAAVIAVTFYKSCRAKVDAACRILNLTDAARQKLASEVESLNKDFVSANRDAERAFDKGVTEGRKQYADAARELLSKSIDVKIPDNYTLNPAYDGTIRKERFRKREVNEIR